MRKQLKKIISTVVMLAVVVTSVPWLSVGMAVEAYSSGYPNTHTNTGNQKEDIIAVAETQIGYTYSSGTKYGAWYDENYGTNFEKAAWCAMFVSWCANQAKQTAAQAQQQ